MHRRRLHPTAPCPGLLRTANAFTLCSLVALSASCSADFDDPAIDAIPCSVDADCQNGDVCGTQGYCVLPMADRANFGAPAADAGPADPNAANPNAANPGAANSSDAGPASDDEGSATHENGSDGGAASGSIDAGDKPGCLAAADCDDGLPCTEDACENGTCTYPIAKNYCAIDGACVMATTDGPKPCTVCNPAVDAKKWVANIGSTCDDGSACTTGDACTKEATCQGKADAGCCEKDADCVASGACKAGICDVAKMTCTFLDVPACCTKDSECKGTKTDCVAPGCDVQTNTCTMIPAADGKACEDGNACTANDGCSMGTCKGGKGCDDNNPCTADMCAAGKCVHSPVPNCCAAGVCCDVAKNTVKAKGAVCGQNARATEHKCLGPVLMVRNAFDGCTGKAVTCSSSKSDWVWQTWKKQQDCGKQATCTVDAKGGRCKPKPPPKGDLIIASLKTGLGVYKAGASVTVTATVHNQSAGPAGAHRLQLRLSKDTKWSGSDLVLASSKRPKLAAGDVDVVILGAKLPAKLGHGKWHVLARADVDNAVAELQEGNNVRAAAFKVSPPPPPERADLAALWFKPMSATALPGGNVSMIFELGNSGEIASGAFKIDFRLSKDGAITSKDLGLGAMHVAGLKAGEKRPLAFTAKLPGSIGLGSWHLGMRIDVAGAVKEKNESNNSAAHKLTIIAPPKATKKPDLQVVAVSGDGGVSGAKTKVVIKVRNVGKAASKAFRIDLRLSEDAAVDGSDYLMVTRDFGGLAANTSATATVFPTIPAAAKPGSWVIGARADVLDAVDESDETNNARLAVIKIAAPPPPAKPDFAMNLATVNPSSVLAGEAIKCLATLHNHGGSYGNGIRVSYRLSKDMVITGADKLLGWRTVLGAQKGAKEAVGHTVQVPATTPPGDYFVGMIADSLGAVAESNEKNNVAIAKLVVAAPPAPKPDLNAAYFKTTAGSYKAGNKISLMAIVTNAGGGAAGVSKVSVLLSADKKVDKDDGELASWTVGALAPGGQDAQAAQVGLPTKMATGTWYLLLIIDSDHAVSESNESNNVVPAAFTISK